MTFMLNQSCASIRPFRTAFLRNHSKDFFKTSHEVRHPYKGLKVTWAFFNKNWSLGEFRSNQSKGFFFTFGKNGSKDFGPQLKNKGLIKSLLSIRPSVRNGFSQNPL